MKDNPFPPWTNKMRDLLGVAAAGGLLYVVVLVWTGFSPDTIAVGYKPKQPVPFSHALHAGQLGMDCRYCHQTVENAAHAAIPSTETCMGCHERIHTESHKLLPVRESWATGESIPWVRVHDLPDYAYFDHSAHVQSGVGCSSCHGRIDQMEEVTQTQSLSMGWCLDCHRNPEPHLRPLSMITKMDYPIGDDPKRDPALGAKLRDAHGVSPQTSCSTCHR